MRDETGAACRAAAPYRCSGFDGCFAGRPSAVHDDAADSLDGDDGAPYSLDGDRGEADQLDAFAGVDAQLVHVRREAIVGADGRRHDVEGDP